MAGPAWRASGSAKNAPLPEAAQLGSTPPRRSSGWSTGTVTTGPTGSIATATGRRSRPWRVPPDPARRRADPRQTSPNRSYVNSAKPSYGTPPNLLCAPKLRRRFGASGRRRDVPGPLPPEGFSGSQRWVTISPPPGTRPGQNFGPRLRCAVITPAAGSGQDNGAPDYAISTPGPAHVSAAPSGPSFNVARPSLQQVRCGNRLRISRTPRRWCTRPPLCLSSPLNSTRAFRS